MTDTWVRLTAVTLENFKNVVRGSLDLSVDNGVGSLLALYGQNGSGKTALIRALAFLKSLLAGRSLPEDFSDSIHVKASSARLAFEFRVTPAEGGDPIRVAYEVVLARKKMEAASELWLTDPVRETAEIQSEKFVVWLSGGEGVRKTCLIDTSEDLLPFGPKARLLDLVGRDRTVHSNLQAERRLAQERRQSFVFSGALYQTIKAKMEREATESSSVLQTVEGLIFRLWRYGMSELFVIEPEQAGLVSLNAMPLQMKAEPAPDHPGVSGAVLLPMSGVGWISEELLPVVNHIIGEVNLVLNQLVPGLTVQCQERYRETGPKGEGRVAVELVSLKNEEPISLRYESDGIKKIFSVLHLLICAYNDRTVTVAIDELDAGVFEYLLGEMVRLMADHGWGQLIFTSHNLRVLETVNRKFIAFTSADPARRYLRMKNIKGTNNLRDVYYRDIFLGPEDETPPFYTPTNNAAIAMAMRKAGAQHHG